MNWISHRFLSFPLVAVLTIVCGSWPARTAMAADCGTWAPGVTVAEASGRESKALTISWTNDATNFPPVACENDNGDHWEGTDHLELHIAEGSVVSSPSSCSSSLSGPVAPSASTLVASLPSTASDVTVFVHRSAKKHAFTLFACEGETCSDRYYSDGNGDNEAITVGSDEDYDCTLKETWELTGITGESDTGTDVVGIHDANAPHAFYYPASGWFGGSPDLSDRLVMYFGIRSATGPSRIFYKLHNDTGWPSGGFNGSASWDTGVLVAEGDEDTGDTGDYYPDYMADHPWAMLASDTSGGHYVVLFAQTQPQDPGTRSSHVVQIMSNDEYGDDFGLSCIGGDCSSDILDLTTASIAIDPLITGTSTEYVVHARHGRVGWHYLADPWLTEGSDSADMLVMLERPSSGGSCVNTDADDIGKATGSWDSTAGQWEWTVTTDTGSPDCPVIQTDNAHDPGLIPLPGGEYKMYFVEGGVLNVAYWDGSAWEDKAPIVLRWDGSSSSGPSHACAENPSTLVHKRGSIIREGMFFRLMDTLLCVEQTHGSGETCGDHSSTVGLDDDTPTACQDKDDNAIVFAEHTN